MERDKDDRWRIRLTMGQGLGIKVFYWDSEFQNFTASQYSATIISGGALKAQQERARQRAITTLDSNGQVGNYSLRCVKVEWEINAHPTLL